ncbi:MAG: bifunctional riboflavin kinase/FMN adenylyltransferase, partial [Christensenellales bacterium]
YTFGKGGQGTSALIRAMSAQLGFRAVMVESVRLGGDIVSSTLIRRLLAEGQTGRAATLLG